MYEHYWQLQSNPFLNDLDTEFFFASATHQAALLKMRYVVEHSRGAGVLIGGSGYGKTYLAQKLVWDLKEVLAPVVHIPYPRMSPTELLAYIADSLDDGANSETTSASQLDQILRVLEHSLISHTRNGLHPLILVDETHQIEDPKVLQVVQLLLNLQQRSDINFTLLMVGEATLIGQIQRMAGLENRISVQSLLQPLNADETSDYITHRLRVAGSEKPIFSPAAVQSIFELSSGVPQKINRLCDLALLVGYADELTTLSTSEIEAVAEELTLVVPD